MTAYQKLEKVFRRRARLAHLQSLASWDSSVMMPPGSSEARGEAMAEAAVMQVELLKAPDLTETFQKAETQTDLNDWQKANLFEMKRVWKNENCISVDLVEKRSIARNRSEMAWRDLRKENNWKDFLPLQKEVIELTREEARQRAESSGTSPYDALLQIYDPGLTSDQIDVIFNELKEKLPGLIERITEKQKNEEVIPTRSTFPIEKQKILNAKVIETFGFDFNRGRVDTSVHPFCGGSPQDVRITTRYSDKFLWESLSSAIHETGHASYEQGLPQDWLDQPVGDARSTTIHESQSLLFENLVGCSKEFFQHLTPHIVENFEANADDKYWSTENLHRISTRIRRENLIRVEADEVTYPMHVVLRYEVEKAFIEGALEVEDLPDAWNEKMKNYLGLDIKGNFKDGCMQDVHWPLGLIGYFPSYTLGAMTATQFYAAACKARPEIPNEVAKGNLEPIRQWLGQNVWAKGSSLPTSDLVTQATGSTLQSHYFLNHLESRYLA